MNKEYVFPENNWYLKIDDENRDLVNNWRINIIKCSTKPCQYTYINWRGEGEWWAEVEITTSQFKKYVLGIDSSPIIEEDEDEDYNYLISFLEKINMNKC
jgi:hypothetical protein